MSYDSNYPNYPPNFPGYGPPGYPPPPPGYPGSDPAAARQRALLPGIFLIIIGILSILGAGLFMFAAMALRSDPNQYIEIIEEAMARQHQELNMTPEEFLNWYISTLNLAGSVGLFSGLIVLLGGIAMVTARLYGLAVFAGIVACVPCLTAMGCCGLGQAFGIWALVVLFNSEVRAAFK